MYPDVKPGEGTVSERDLDHVSHQLDLRDSAGTHPTTLRIAELKRSAGFIVSPSQNGPCRLRGALCPPDTLHSFPGSELAGPPSASRTLYHCLGRLLKGPARIRQIYTVLEPFFFSLFVFFHVLAFISSAIPDAMRRGGRVVGEL
ncbi:hypothetical protein BgiBS90_005920 [Biomphalaria glabrata]|nr:hypothetical protein BgiBS90_005920 [Biomphalaria glabrata]